MPHLRQCLRLVHLQGEDLGRCDRRKRRVRSQGLRHAHRDGGLAGTRLASNEDGTASNTPLPNHLQDDARRLARVCLAHHTCATGDADGETRGQGSPPRLKQEGAQQSNSPWLTARASRASSSPRPRMCECAPMRSMRVMSLTSAVFTCAMAAESEGPEREKARGSTMQEQERYVGHRGSLVVA